MVKVDSTSALLDAVRSELATRAERSRLTAEKSGTPAAAQRSASPLTLETVRQRIGREIDDLDLKLPASRRRARLAFIESLLAWEFGDTLLTDPQFDELVREIDDSVTASPDVAAALEQVLAQLQGR